MKELRIIWLQGWDLFELVVSWKKMPFSTVAQSYFILNFNWHVPECSLLLWIPTVRRWFVSVSVKCLKCESSLLSLLVLTFFLVNLFTHKVYKIWRNLSLHEMLDTCRDCGLVTWSCSSCPIPVCPSGPPASREGRWCAVLPLPSVRGSHGMVVK